MKVRLQEKYKNEIIKVRPGLSGMGSIVFRDEENMMDANNDPDKFYDEIIMPYKGSLEEWYVSSKSMWTYFCLVVLTAWVVFLPNSNLAWRLFKDLPEPPDDLNSWLI